MGQELGAGLLLDYARRFGFYEDPPVDLPADERVPSGLYSGGDLVPQSEERNADPGRLAFGQERMLVTPMQMAMVAATVANGGVVMEPTLTDRIRAPDGSIVERFEPDELRRAIKEETARELTAMMEAAVAGGTGTAAQIAGVRVAGKTGTAETGRAGRNVAGFIAFAPVERPRVAIAVYLQNQSGTGGSIAAPIAKQVMQALLRVPSNSQPDER
jgi:peptidoglycan glycosyltransferase